MWFPAVPEVVDAMGNVIPPENPRLQSLIAPVPHRADEDDGGRAVPGSNAGIPAELLKPIILHLLKIWQRQQPEMDDKLIVRPWLKLCQRKDGEAEEPGWVKPKKVKGKKAKRGSKHKKDHGSEPIPEGDGEPGAEPAAHNASTCIR